jgi:hypothetical protein
MRAAVLLLASAAMSVAVVAGQEQPQPQQQQQTQPQDQQQAQPRNPPPQPAAPPPWNASDQAPAPASAVSNALPAGTVVAIRTIDVVDSEHDQAGKIYRASLSQDLVVNGQTIARKGDLAEMRLRRLSQAGRLSGSAEVTLALSSVTINGKPIPVTSGDVSQDSKGKGGKTARNAGIGAVAGGLLGALAGGGKGAAIGMASGGALGAGASAVTKGPKVRIPSETLLRFTLAESAAY